MHANLPPALTDQLRQRAKELGFVFCGITTPLPPPHIAQYEQWLADDRHGNMAYMATDRNRQRRADPRLIMPTCKSIIVVALPYQPARADSTIAAYALGADYHDVIPPRLRLLIDWLAATTGKSIASKLYTDTGPLLERELAQRAGLGWIGKNTMLINPKAGSCFLLGEALIDFELPSDTPFAADHCGTCTRCIAACPTQAILPGRVLDAPRCISYLTIELKDNIPTDLADQMGSWIFGCDICQAVCPWNERFAHSLAAEPQLAPARPAPDLAQELQLSAEQFNAKFKNSPIKRAKRRGYLRNVAIALGNRGDGTARAALQLAADPLHETDEQVRRHAAQALNKLTGARHV